MNSLKTVMGVLAAIGMVACGGTQTVGSKYVYSENVPSSKGALIEVTAKDSVVLAGTKLEILSGALSVDTKITLEVGMKDVVANPADKAGPVAVWGPAGTKFNTPIRMTLPYALPTGKAKSDLSILVKEADGTMLRLKNSVLTLNSATNTVSFMVSGFTSFQPSTQPACTADRDCATGEACVSNVCVPAANDAGPADGGAGGGNPGVGGGGGNPGVGGGAGGMGGAGGTGGTGGGGGGGGGGVGGGTGGAGGGGTGGGSGAFCRTDFECVIGQQCINMTCTPSVDGGSGGGTGGSGGGNPSDGGMGGSGGGNPSDGGSGGGTGGSGGGNPSDGGSDGGAGGGSGVDAGSGLNCFSSLDCPMPEVCNANRCVAISCIPAVPCPGSFSCVSGWCQ